MNWKYALIAGLVALGAILYFTKNHFFNKEDNVAHWSFKTMDGELVSPWYFKGKNVVLNFWQTTCPPCLKEMPILEEARTRLGDEFVFLAASDEDPDLIRIFEETNDYGFTFLSSIKFALLGVVYYPHTFVLDKEGKLVKQQYGAFKYNATRLADSLRYWTR